MRTWNETGGGGGGENGDQQPCRCFSDGIHFGQLALKWNFRYSLHWNSLVMEPRAQACKMNRTGENSFSLNSKLLAKENRLGLTSTSSTHLFQRPSILVILSTPGHPGEGEGERWRSYPSASLDQKSFDPFQQAYPVSLNSYKERREMRGRTDLVTLFSFADGVKCEVAFHLKSGRGWGRALKKEWETVPACSIIKWSVQMVCAARS